MPDIPIAGLNTLTRFWKVAKNLVENYNVGITGWVLGTLDPHQVPRQDVNPQACTLGWTRRTLHCKKGNDRQTTILGAPLHST